MRVLILLISMTLIGCTPTAIICTHYNGEDIKVLTEFNDNYKVGDTVVIREFYCPGDTFSLVLYHNPKKVKLHNGDIPYCDGTFNEYLLTIKKVLR